VETVAAASGNDMNHLPFSPATLPMNKLSRMTNVTDGGFFFVDGDVLTACGEKSFFHEERNI